MGWFLLAGAIVVAFGSTFTSMWRGWFPAWADSRLSIYQRITEGGSWYAHGPLVPVISLILAVRLLRRPGIAYRPRPWVGGTILVTSLLVHLLSCLLWVTFTSGVAFIGVLVGLILMLWGVNALRRLWFPLAFLLFMVPLPLWPTVLWLRIPLVDWAIAFLPAFGVAAEQVGARIFLTDGRELVVGDVSSGLRTLVALVALGALYAFLCRFRSWWRLGLFVLVVPVVLLSNLLGLASTIVVADVWSVEAATGWYDDVSGVMVFVLALLMMFGLHRLGAVFSRVRDRSAKPEHPVQAMPQEPARAGQRGVLFRAVTRRAGWIALLLVASSAGGAWYPSGCQRRSENAANRAV